MEASTDSGSTWGCIFSKTVEQGSTWNTASIDLSSYAGNTVQLRFNVVTGNS